MTSVRRICATGAVLVIFLNVLAGSGAGAQLELGTFAVTLRQGTSGERVRLLQRALDQLGYELTTDGVFGPQTAAAVRKFQLAQRLKVDGVVGPKTWDALRDRTAAEAARQERTYIVRSGDTLAKIARRFNSSVWELAELNGLSDPDVIRVGDKLRLPGTEEQQTETTIERAPGETNSAATEADIQALDVSNQKTGLYVRKQDEPRDIERRPIALTFDDGPDPVYTPRILEVLKEAKVRATFFLVGDQVEMYPQVVSMLADEGHQIENHSYSHRQLVGLERETVVKEIERTAQLIGQISGTPTRYFRPPGGGFDRAVLSALEECEHELVLWNNIGGSDLNLDEEEYAVFVDGTVSRAFPGAILMLHTTSMLTTEHLPQLIGELKVRGFTLVTLDELLRAMAADENTKQR